MHFIFINWYTPYYVISRFYLKDSVPLNIFFCLIYISKNTTRLLHISGHEITIQNEKKEVDVVCKLT